MSADWREHVRDADRTCVASLLETVEALLDEENRDAEPGVLLDPLLDVVGLIGRVRVEVVHRSAHTALPGACEGVWVNTAIAHHVPPGVEVELSRL